MEILQVFPETHPIELNDGIWFKQQISEDQKRLWPRYIFCMTWFGGVPKIGGIPSSHPCRKMGFSLRNNYWVAHDYGTFLGIIAAKNENPQLVCWHQEILGILWLKMLEQVRVTNINNYVWRSNKGITHEILKQYKWVDTEWSISGYQKDGPTSTFGGDWKESED